VLPYQPFEAQAVAAPGRRAAYRRFIPGRSPTAGRFGEQVFCVVSCRGGAVGGEQLQCRSYGDVILDADQRLQSGGRRIGAVRGERELLQRLGRAGRPVGRGPGRRSGGFRAEGGSGLAGSSRRSRCAAVVRWAGRSAGRGPRGGWLARSSASRSTRERCPLGSSSHDSQGKVNVPDGPCSRAGQSLTRWRRRPAWRASARAAACRVR
jgi:hypothetical protein